MEYLVTTFYKFTPLATADLPAIKQELNTQAQALNIWGLILIAPEGINATITGSVEGVATYKKHITATFGEMRYKDSLSERSPFKRFKVKIKPEIVQLQRTDIVPTGNEPHLSPTEWDALAAQEDVVLLDVRNAYETKLGTFKNAVDPQTRYFSQFPEWLRQSGIVKHQKIGIFCTGGIRCEKAAVAMKEQGYEQVYQLDGGILNYIAERPQQNFAGECFVFDHRSAVGQDLRPSAVYAPCAVCGNGGELTQTCLQCAAAYRICADCAAAAPLNLCSKNCRYQYTLAQATAK